MVEVDGDLGDAEVARDDKCPHQIVPAVTPSLEGWNLRAGDDDWLAEILKHKRQSRGGVGESVRPVKDYKTAQNKQSGQSTGNSRHPTRQNYDSSASRPWQFVSNHPSSCYCCPGAGRTRIWCR